LKTCFEVRRRVRDGIRQKLNDYIEEGNTLKEKAQ